METINALKFVKGAVATKDFVPELTHFRIENGFVKGFNGRLALCSPIELDIEANPKAKPFIKAIETCKDVISMHITPTGKLSIKSGKFRALVDSTPSEYPNVEPEGEYVDINGPIVETLKILSPYMGVDASRPWACGILLDGNTATATNNIIIAQRWMETYFPLKLVIPDKAVKEIVRIGEEPSGVQVSNTTMTFHYEDGRWLRTNLIELGWPEDSVRKLLERESDPQPIPEGMFEALENLVPFTEENNRIYFMDNKLATHFDENEATIQDVEGVQAGAIMNGKQLLSLQAIANTIDLSQYPAPCMFYGDMLRGCIVGIR